MFTWPTHLDILKISDTYLWPLFRIVNSFHMCTTMELIYVMIKKIFICFRNKYVRFLCPKVLQDFTGIHEILQYSKNDFRKCVHLFIFHEVPTWYKHKPTVFFCLMPSPRSTRSCSVDDRILRLQLQYRAFVYDWHALMPTLQTHSFNFASSQRIMRLRLPSVISVRSAVHVRPAWFPGSHANRGRSHESHYQLINHMNHVIRTRVLKIVLTAHDHTHA